MSGILQRMVSNRVASCPCSESKNTHVFIIYLKEEAKDHEEITGIRKKQRLN
jgi:hypothetical protein